LGAVALSAVGIFAKPHFFIETDERKGSPSNNVAGDISRGRNEAVSGEWSKVPVKGMVTMVDLGADVCIPCKMMAPIIEKLEETYRGKAAIVFIDVWKDKEQAKRFGIRAIPTQIFFDKNGKEVFRHTGFMGEADIVSQLKKMGAG